MGMPCARLPRFNWRHDKYKQLLERKNGEKILGAASNVTIYSGSLIWRNEMVQQMTVLIRGSPDFYTGALAKKIISNG
jgi:hypothetical protein